MKPLRSLLTCAFTRSSKRSLLTLLSFFCSPKKQGMLFWLSFPSQRLTLSSSLSSLVSSCSRSVFSPTPTRPPPPSPGAFSPFASSSLRPPLLAPHLMITITTVFRGSPHGELNLAWSPMVKPFATKYEQQLPDPLLPLLSFHKPSRSALT